MAKRLRIKELRRKELIKATRSIIEEIGFEATTIAKIAERAGFSIGFMHHHFPNRDALLAETMRICYSEMRDIIVGNIRYLSDPRARLEVIIAGNFDPAIYTKANAYIWISYLPRIPFHPIFRRLQKVIERRLHSNLIIECRRIDPQGNNEATVREVMMLIDSYWLRLGIGCEDTESLREEALELSRQLLDRL